MRTFVPAMLLALISALILSPASDTLATSYATAFKERVPLERLATPVSVLLPSDIKSGGIVGQGRLSAQVPGLLIPDYGASLTSTIYLRGIGSRMENPSMGLYVDGIPIMDKKYRLQLSRFVLRGFRRPFPVSAERDVHSVLLLWLLG